MGSAAPRPTATQELRAVREPRKSCHCHGAGPPHEPSAERLRWAMSAATRMLARKMQSEAANRQKLQTVYVARRTGRPPWAPTTDDAESTGDYHGKAIARTQRTR